MPDERTRDEQFEDLHAEVIRLEGETARLRADLQQHGERLLRFLRLFEPDHSSRVPSDQEVFDKIAALRAECDRPQLRKFQREWDELGQRAEKAEADLAALRAACAAIPRYTLVGNGAQMVKTENVKRQSVGEWIKAADLDRELRRKD